MVEIAPYPLDPRYGVTRCGRVYRIVRSVRGRPVPFEMAQRLGDNGYFYVGSGKASGLHCSTVHRMVAVTFIPNPEGLPQVAHRDGCRDRNAVGNLRWDTPVGNAADRPAHGTDWRGEKHRQAKLSDAAIRAIRASKRSDTAEASVQSVSRSNVSRIRRGEGWPHVTA